MDLRVLTGPPGSGKSLRMLDQMIVEPGCYLLCAPRTQLIDEQAVYLDDRARDQGADVPVVTIHSGQRGQRGVVARRVQDKLRRTAEGTSVSHAIVGITHETLMGLDPADIAGWHVRIDEVPDNSFTSGSISIRASWPSLTRHYDLVPIEGSPWARLTAREGVAPLKRAQIAGDAATPLAALHKAAQCPNRITVINLRDWADAAHATRPIRWWSFWSFATLSECTSVTMTGASFTGSIAYHAMMRFDGEAINLTENMVGSEIIRANPQISIHYYATHAGSTEWWETDEGSLCLVEISRHLERIRFDGFWTANDSIKNYFRHRLPGQNFKPRLAGTNLLRSHQACAAFYSNKAQSADESAIEILGLNREDIQHARESEDLYQFVMRGAIRNPLYDGTYDVHVYSRDQAEMLAQRMRDAGISTDITLCPVLEAGIMGVRRPNDPGGSENAEDHSRPTTDQRKARERDRGKRRRQISRDQSKSHGTYRPPGRPKRRRDTIHIPDKVETIATANPLTAP